MPRQTLRFLNDTQVDPGLAVAAYRSTQILRWCTLLDDMAFSESGVPVTPAGVPSPLYEGRYSWAYLLRAPVAAQSTQAQGVNLSVVVYSGRQPALTNGGGLVGESAYVAVFDPSKPYVTVTWNPAVQEKPAIRRGGWICDATMPIPPATAPINGYFYRVVGVSDTGPNSMDVELQSNPIAAANPGVLLILENVVEVFDKGVLQ
jgi:hypothetical protein